MRNEDDNGQLRIPPQIPQVTEGKITLYSHNGKPLVRSIGFRGERVSCPKSAILCDGPLCAKCLSCKVHCECE